MGIFRRHQERREQRATAPLMSAINDNVQRQFGELFRICGGRQTQILYAKWRLGETDWKPGDLIRRPLSVDEFADRIGVTVEEARRIDSIMVKQFRPVAESDFGRIYMDFLVVPIDQAQAWWDEMHGETATPDGDFRR
jgi:hypothetical protein